MAAGYRHVIVQYHAARLLVALKVALLERHEILICWFGLHENFSSVCSISAIFFGDDCQLDKSLQYLLVSLQGQQQEKRFILRRLTCVL